jgi:hypothetical protein
LTRDISTGGICFEAELGNGFRFPAERDAIHVELTVPPGDGHFPYQGSVTSVAEVLRCERLGAAPGRHPRVRIAARWREPLKLAF